jgi:hypothetical protein
VRRYPVTVEEGRALAAEAERRGAAATGAARSADRDPPRPGMVRGPYAVETYPVEIDGAYVVVEV